MLPPPDLAQIDIPMLEIRAGDTLYRAYRLTYEPLWFGVGQAPVNRFDDPRQEYGVCYFGRTREAAFAETLLRRAPVRLVSREFIDARGFAEFTVQRPLQLVRAYGSGLAQLGTTAAIASGPYTTARLWSRALWEHPSSPDGVQYHCRHDDDAFGIALYDRAADAIGPVRRSGIREDSVWFGSVLERYKLGLDD